MITLINESQKLDPLFAYVRYFKNFDRLRVVDQQDGGSVWHESKHRFEAIASKERSGQWSSERQ
ncbi:hypothetical protein [Vibrio alginolyticus]|uniref:hypothetical protein n=1 Tax=Vibrio alginolyticus TaxID=663 RepID=UPI001CD13AE9|nr:hypothetical protein [Vibrio alginolyticus]